MPFVSSGEFVQFVNTPVCLFIFPLPRPWLCDSSFFRFISLPRSLKLSMSVSVCLSVCLSQSLYFFSLSLSLSIALSVYLSLYLSVCFLPLSCHFRIFFKFYFHRISPRQFSSLSFFLNKYVSLFLPSISDSSSPTLSLFLPPSPSLMI